MFALVFLAPFAAAYFSDKLSIPGVVGKFYHDQLTGIVFGDLGFGTPYALSPFVLCDTSNADLCEYPDLYRFQSEIRTAGVYNNQDIPGLIGGHDVARIEDAHFNGDKHEILYWRGNEANWQTAI